MEQITTFAITLLLLFLLHCTTETCAESAAAPAPAGPLNITAILEKAGQFGTLIRLLKSTQVTNQLNNQLNNSNTGITIFAPTDNAFSGLSPGTLNSLTDQQKVALIQFHILPSAVTVPQFQTVSNPLRTQAGDASNGQYPLNITTMGNQVNISTGIINTTISNTLYSDSQLAVYQVDKVLLPLGIFRPSAPASAPAPSKSTKNASSDGPSSSTTKDSADASVAASLISTSIMQGIALATTMSFFCWNL